VLAVVQSNCSDILVDLKELFKACILNQPIMHIQQEEINETAMSIDLLIYELDLQLSISCP
jgi:homospermidine synthase